METNLYKKVEKFVIDSFTKPGGNTRHYLRTAYWVKKLKPSTDEALLIAAVAHDIERAFREPDYNIEFRKGFRTKKHLVHHQERGAEIIVDFLQKQNADEKLIKRVKMLVSKHETGGNAEQNLLKDADSLSFFENNIDLFVAKFVPEAGKENVKDKFDWMYNRITSRKAKQIAKPYYQRAISFLRD